MVFRPFRALKKISILVTGLCPVLRYFALSGLLKKTMIFMKGLSRVLTYFALSGSLN